MRLHPPEISCSSHSSIPEVCKARDQSVYYFGMRDLLVQRRRRCKRYVSCARLRASRLEVELSTREGSTVLAQERWKLPVARITARVGCLLSNVVAIALHVRFVTQVGGTWRNEPTAFNLATLPDSAGDLSVPHYDSIRFRSCF